MVKWADIPVAHKLATAAVTSLAAVVIWLFSTFETSQGAEVKWSQHNQAIACRTVYEYEKQISRYRERIQFDKSMSADDKIWINAEIARLGGLVERIDPNGAC